MQQFYFKSLPPTSAMTYSQKWPNITNLIEELRAVKLFPKIDRFMSSKSTNALPIIVLLTQSFSALDRLIPPVHPVQ